MADETCWYSDCDKQPYIELDDYDSEAGPPEIVVGEYLEKGK